MAEHFEDQVPGEATTSAAGQPRRILVIANETVAGEVLRDTIAVHSRGQDVAVLVVCPALNSRLRTWTSDTDGAMAQAAQRLERSLAALAELGIEAEGRVGDTHPLQAIQDALRTFHAHEIIISTHPPGQSNWLEKRVVEGARALVSLPITHVIVDLADERRTAARERVVEQSDDSSSTMSSQTALRQDAGV